MRQVVVDDVVTVGQIAKRLGRSRQSVHLWIRGDRGPGARRHQCVTGRPGCRRCTAGTRSPGGCVTPGWSTWPWTMTVSKQSVPSTRCLRGNTPTCGHRPAMRSSSLRTDRSDGPLASAIVAGVTAPVRPGSRGCRRLTRAPRRGAQRRGEGPWPSGGKARRCPGHSPQMAFPALHRRRCGQRRRCAYAVDRDCLQ